MYVYSIKKAMKKIIYALGAAMVLFSMAACSETRNGSCSKKKCCDDKVYTGVIPAADAEGIRYTLKLDYSDDHNYTTGDYDLLETYIVGDSASASGVRDAASFRSEGDFTVERKDGRSYIKLMQDVKDSSAGSNAGPIYFLVDSDSTLTMVDAGLRLAATPGMNYTLKLAR